MTTLETQYQNEKTHIFYNGKTNRKYLQIPNLKALTLGRIKKITLYLDTEFRALKTNLNMVYIQNLQLLLTHKTCPTSKSIMEPVKE